MSINHRLHQLILIFSLLSSGLVQAQGTWEAYGDANSQIGGMSILSNGDRILSGIHQVGSVNEMFLVKASSSGAILWDKRYQASPNPLNFYAIPTSDGGFFAGGRVASGGGDLVGIKLDANGNVSWANVISGNFAERFGGVAQAADGDLIVAGWSDGHGPHASPTPSPGQPDGFLFEFSPTGSKNWARAFGVALGDKLYSVKATSSGYVAVGRSFHSGALDGFLVATDPSGVPIARHIYYLTGASSSAERFFDIIPTSDGGYLATGHYRSSGEDVLLIKLSSSYAVQWTKTYNVGGREYGNRLLESGGHYYVGGSTNVGGLDALFMKVDLSGNLVWARTYNGGGSEYARDIFPGGGSSIVAAVNTTSIGSGSYDISVVRFLDNLDSCATDITSSVTTTNRSFTRDPGGSQSDVTASVSISPLSITAVPANYAHTAASCSTAFAAVPTISQWGLILLGLLVLCLGGIVIWRRQYPQLVRNRH